MPIVARGARRLAPGLFALALAALAGCGTGGSPVAPVIDGSATCDGGACACTGPACGQVCAGPCSLACGSNSNCAQTCNATACDITCNSNSGCSQACVGGACTMTCNSISGTGCTLDCPGGNCVLTCNSSQPCRITSCTRGCTLNCRSSSDCQSSCTDTAAGCVTNRN